MVLERGSHKRVTSLKVEALQSFVASGFIGYNEIVSEYGKLHLRRVLPGNHPGIDGSQCQWQGRSAGGIEGKRHNGPAYPRGDRVPGLQRYSYRGARNGRNGAGQAGGGDPGNGRVKF